MPEHRLHALVCKLLLGRSHLDVDRFLDSTYVVSGRWHRHDWVHSPLGAMLYAAAKGWSAEKFAAGLIHLALDNADRRVIECLRILSALLEKSCCTKT